MISLAMSTFVIDLSAQTKSTDKKKEPLTCKSFEGVFKGTKVGSGWQGNLTITNDDRCNSHWVAEGLNNFCDIKIKENENLYQCSLGSIGHVKIEGKKLSFRNTYTGNSYDIKTEKIK